MNRSFLKSLLVAGLVLTGLSAFAQQNAVLPVLADPGKGAKVYLEGDAARGLPACVSCHGAAGNSTIAANPKLAHQIEAYSYKQLVDFTTDARSNPVMTAFSKMLTDEEKKNIAAYLAVQVAKPGAARNPELVELGKQIYRGGIAATGVAACASCHGASGSGIPSQYPRLAGQHQDYTLAQLQAFKSETRKNSPQMTTLAGRMTDKEMQAVADYIAGLK